MARIGRWSNEEEVGEDMMAGSLLEKVEKTRKAVDRGKKKGTGRAQPPRTCFHFNSRPSRPLLFFYK